MPTSRCARPQPPTQRRAAGEAGALLGVPIAHKDIFVTRDLPTTAGSKMLAGYRSPFDATVVARLAEAGAVTLGKLNCDEFAMGSAQRELGLRRRCSNPWDATRVPGGSSGGSAAAVAARLLPAATGTDTGGSIRQPASFTGITGIKPTYGVCSRYGHDRVRLQPRPGRPAGAQRRGLRAAARRDERLRRARLDQRRAAAAGLPRRAAAAPRDGASAARPLEGLRIGLPREFFPAALAADVDGAVRAALAELETLGATLVDVSLPRTELSIPVYYIIAPAEASSNLSRFDGVQVRPPRRAVRRPARHVQEEPREGFGAEVKRRIMIGTYVLSPRLLRRLLPAGAEAAPHDRRRLPGLLRAAAT